MVVAAALAESEPNLIDLCSIGKYSLSLNLMEFGSDSSINNGSFIFLLIYEFIVKIRYLLSRLATR